MRERVCVCICESVCVWGGGVAQSGGFESMLSCALHCLITGVMVCSFNWISTSARPGFVLVTNKLHVNVYRTAVVIVVCNRTTTRCPVMHQLFLYSFITAVDSVGS